MTYNYATFDEIKTKAALRLSDGDRVFWQSSELGIYINSALREWNAISRIFRDRGVFITVANQVFYDLRTLLLNGDGEAFLSPTVTDAELLTQAKFQLIEPSPTDDTSFTDGFDLSDFNNAFEQARNQFLLDTGIYISQPTAQIVAAGDGRVTFDDDSIIDVRRATWTDSSGNITQLMREDEFTSASFSPIWPQDPSTPQRYAIYPDPLLTIQLIPAPTDTGTLTIQSISSGTVPDDFTPFILWGALANVLAAPGPGGDNLRASYAAQRYAEGIIIGKQYATLQQGYINGVPANTESVYDLDTFQPSWMTAGTPTSIAALGPNLIAVAPVANGVFSVMIDAVRNAPQLVNVDDPFPLGREYLDIFLDYVCHLAAFKQGGAEFQATFPQYDSFVKAAIAYNNRMSAQNLNFDTLVDKAMQQEIQQNLRTEQVA